MIRQDVGIGDDVPTLLAERSAPIAAIKMITAWEKGNTTDRSVMCSIPEGDVSLWWKQAPLKQGAIP